MKFNEYELALIKGKLELKVKQSFNKTIEYLDDTLAFLLEQYDLPNLATEKSFVLSYDADGNLTGFMQAGLGDFRGVTVNLNSALKFLLLNNAMGCIFVHNHPKDSELKPSENDYKFSGTISHLCEILRIDMLADIIVQGYDEYYNITKGQKEVLTHDW